MKILFRNNFLLIIKEMSNEEIRIQKKNEYKIWINYNPYRTFTEFL